MWTKEITQELITQYKNGKTIAELMQLFGKSDRSIIAKLSAAKVYMKPVNLSKITGTLPRTKISYVQEIEQVLEMKLPTLEKTSKTTLIALLERIRDYSTEDHQ